MTDMPIADIPKDNHSEVIRSLLTLADENQKAYDNCRPRTAMRLIFGTLATLCHVQIAQLAGDL